MSKRVAIFISGRGSNMMALVDAMQEPDFGATPVLVLSNDPGAGGLVKAAERGIPTASVDHHPFLGDREAFEQALEHVLRPHRINIICMAGFMRMLTAGFIRNWQQKVINVHPSLLPKYKGLQTHQRAIDAGDTIAGCSIHEVTTQLDGGPILGQTEVPVLPEDTAESLAARVLVQEHILYPQILKRFIQRSDPPTSLP